MKKTIAAILLLMSSVSVAHSGRDYRRHLDERFNKHPDERYYKDTSDTDTQKKTTITVEKYQGNWEDPGEGAGETTDPEYGEVKYEDEDGGE